MVLAAGEGLRMRPLTGERAKPALPLMNRPLLLHVLDLLARQGIAKAVVNLHHRPESVRAILDGPLPRGLQVATSFEPALLGTGGGIRAAMEHFDREAPLLVANADSLCDADLAALAAAYEENAARHRAPATLAVKPREEGETYSAVHLDRRGDVSGIGDVGETGEPVTFIGLHVLSPEAVARIPAGAPSDIVRDVYLPALREGRRLGAHRHRGWWVEAGTPALYLRIHLRLLRQAAFLGALPPQCGSPLAGPGPSWIGPGGDGAGRARIESSVLGPGCRIGSEVAIVRSVLAAGVTVGSGARVEDSVIWENVAIPGGAAVRGSLMIREVGAPGARSVPLS
jgi:NDP-sugar pyrophosphorylase family protein